MKEIASNQTQSMPIDELLKHYEFCMRALRYMQNKCSDTAKQRVHELNMLISNMRDQLGAH